MKRAASVLLLLAMALMLTAGLCVAAATEEAPEAEGYYITGKVVNYSAGVSISIDTDGELASFGIAENCAAPDTLEVGTMVEVEVMNEKAVSVIVI